MKNQKVPENRLNRLVCIRRISMLGALLMIFSMGCADIHQVVHVNHDGTGKIVEKISITPRGYRMIKGLAVREGRKIDKPGLLTKAFLAKRYKSMGAVKLVSSKEVPLPDGRLQLQVVYSFTDVNKIQLWHAPTMKYLVGGKVDKNKATDGRVAFGYAIKPRESWGRIYREVFTLRTLMRTGGLPKKKAHTPAQRQEFKEIVPIFQDVLKDFKLFIEVVAPIEDFEERDMIQRFRVNGNRAIVLKIEGKDLVSSPEALRAFLSNQVLGGGHLAGSIRRMVPGIENPWFNNYHAKTIRFMKTEQAPKK